MIAAFIILSSLLAILPTLTMVDGTLANGVVSAIVAIALIAVALTLHAGDLNRFSRLLGSAAFVVLFIPCLWMLLQVLPIPIHGLTNPIWLSASSALDKPLVGAVSLDIGATLLSLNQYCASLAAGFVAATVTLNRPRAESILSLLTAIAGLIAAELIGFDLDYLRLPGFERADAINVAVIGFILSCATTILAFDRPYTPGTRPRHSRTMTKVAASASIAILFICLSAILISADTVLVLASMFGAAIPISALAIHKWRLGPWGLVGIAALAAVTVVGIFAVVPVKKDVDPTIILSTQAQISSVARMLSDTRWAGSGAGSFEALLPVYRDIHEVNSREIPTAAAATAIEMGQPFLWACVIAFLIGAWTLFKRSLRRGRDYVYSSAGAGCIMALLISFFSNGGILGLTASMMIGVLSGLAFAQSKSASNVKLFEELYSIASGNTDRPARGSSMKSSRSSKIWLRVILALFGVFLLVQAIWILDAERYGLDQIPADGKTAAMAFAEQNKVKQIASFAVVRGDLWAESALTYKLWIDQPRTLSAGDKTEALKTLIQALKYSPHRGDVWLIFAALADRYKWSGYQPISLLKMSYYTAPNETALFPLRLNVSLQAKGAMDDAELQDMIRRDIVAILTREPNLKPALIAAYRTALPQGKIFAERVISETDPGYLNVIRAGNP